MRLDQFVTTQRTTMLRVCSLVPAYAGDRRLSILAELSAVSALATATAAGAVVRIRVCRPGPQGCATDIHGAVVEGWHNIIVSPEDLRGPDFGRVPTAADPSPASLAAPPHPCSPVCAACGRAVPRPARRRRRSSGSRCDWPVRTIEGWTPQPPKPLRHQVLAQGGQFLLPAINAPAWSTSTTWGSRPIDGERVVAQAW